MRVFNLSISAFVKCSLSLSGTFMLVLAGVSTAYASNITTPGLTVSSGGITFSNFTCASSGTGTSNGGCSSITVAGLTPEPAGLEFTTNLSVSGSGTADAVLGFGLSSTSLINTVGLSFTSTFMGMEVNSVAETVYASQNGPVVGYADVICGAVAVCTSATDNISLNGDYNSLYVIKDISLVSFDSTGIGTQIALVSGGTISSITQTYTEVPEPASFVLGGGVLLLGLVSRMRNRQHR
jgi:hypothetical protein